MGWWAIIMKSPKRGTGIGAAYLMLPTSYFGYISLLGAQVGACVRAGKPTRAGYPTGGHSKQGALVKHPSQNLWGQHES